MSGVLCQRSLRQFSSFAESDDAGGILRTGPLFLLLCSAVYETWNIHAFSLIERTDSLRSVDLVG